MTRWAFYVILPGGGRRQCETIVTRWMLDAAHAFARQRGYRPEDCLWLHRDLGARLILGSYRFDVEMQVCVDCPNKFDYGWT